MSRTGKQVWDRLSPTDRYAIASTRQKEEIPTRRFPEYDFTLAGRNPPRVGHSDTSAGMAIMAVALMAGVIRRR